MKGYLPWIDIYVRGFNKFENIKKMKVNTSLDDLCQECPEEFKTFIEYSRNLRFDERPDYDYLRSLIKQICFKNLLEVNYNKFDWMLKKV